MHISRNLHDREIQLNRRLGRFRREVVADRGQKNRRSFIQRMIYLSHYSPPY